MKFIGSLATTGGPVLFTTAELVREWDGTDGDYWALIEDMPHPPERITTYITKTGTRVGVFLTQTGNWSLFASHEEILLVEVRHAPQDFVLEAAVLDFSDVALEPDVLSLAGFGGRVVLFDSTLAGEGIDLSAGPIARSEPYEGGWHPPDIAVIEVDRGTWTVSTFIHEDETAEVRLEGALFQLIDGATEQ